MKLFNKNRRWAIGASLVVLLVAIVWGCDQGQTEESLGGDSLARTAFPDGACANECIWGNVWSCKNAGGTAATGTCASSQFCCDTGVTHNEQCAYTCMKEWESCSGRVVSPENGYCSDIQGKCCNTGSSDADSDSDFDSDSDSDSDCDISDVLKTPADNWLDSYSANGKCYCYTTYDHNIGSYKVNTPAGVKTVKEVCNKIGPGPGKGNNPIYNDIQCGNGPTNDAGDEDYCPGRVDQGKSGCCTIGPKWDLSVYE